MHITKISPKVNEIGLTNQIKSHSLLYAGLQNNHDKCKCCPGSHVQWYCYFIHVSFEPWVVTVFTLGGGGGGGGRRRRRRVGGA